MSNDNRKHVIYTGSGGMGCVHTMHRSPLGWPRSGEVGELHRCPKCGGWWKRDKHYSSVWHRVGFFDFKARRAIREHEIRERGMTVIVKSDAYLEDN